MGTPLLPTLPLPQLLQYHQHYFKSSLNSYPTATCTYKSEGPPYSNTHATNSQRNSTESCRVPVLDITRLKDVNQNAYRGRCLMRGSYTHHYIRKWTENTLLSFVITTGSATLRFSLTSQNTQTKHTSIYSKRITWSMKQKQRGSTESFEGANCYRINTWHNPQFWKLKIQDTTKKFAKKSSMMLESTDIQCQLKLNIESDQPYLKSLWLVSSAKEMKDWNFDMLKALIFINSI
jgi:hypothetical protein